MEGSWIRSTCGLCQIGCGILIELKGGRVTSIKGDPDHPLNRGILCIKGLSSIEYLYHPKRLKYPLKREKSGQLRRISWDEALFEIAQRMRAIRDRWGPESIVFMRGGAKGLQDDYLSRFANAFGSPNITSMAHVCFIPRRMASILTYGFYAIPDFDHPPSTIIVWANNVSDTLHHVYERIKKAKEKGSYLIVIDPLRTKVAQISDMWVKIRPGTDLALALSMIRVIIEEKLWDENFVEEFTYGFEHLKENTVRYDPKVIEKVTDVPHDLIRKIARIFATRKPASIQWGNGIDHTIHNFQTARAICILRAITGNLGRRGGDIYFSSPKTIERGSNELTLYSLIPPEIRRRRIGEGHILPNLFYSVPQLIIDAILEEKPYPIKGAYIQGGNFLLSYPNAKRVHRALQKLELLVISENFITPTAYLAHYILPVSTFFEFDSLHLPPYSIPVVSVQRKVAACGDVRSDYEILRDLSKQLGFGQVFWENERDCLDFILSPLGIGFEELAQRGYIAGEPKPEEHVINGFPTPSGKVEIYSERLKEWGFSPIPELDIESLPMKKTDYPLILTSLKREFFRHSGGKNIETLRRKYPEPLVYVHPLVASSLGLKEGDLVKIETPIGSITQKLHIEPFMHEDTIYVDYGWFFPEEGEETLFGWERSNLNIIIPDTPPYAREMGTPNLRAIPCNIKSLS